MYETALKKKKIYKDSLWQAESCHASVCTGWVSTKHICCNKPVMHTSVDSEGCQKKIIVKVTLKKILHVITGQTQLSEQAPKAYAKVPPPSHSLVQVRFFKNEVKPEVKRFYRVSEARLLIGMFQLLLKGYSGTGKESCHRQHKG